MKWPNDDGVKEKIITHGIPKPFLIDIGLDESLDNGQGFGLTLFLLHKAHSDHFASGIKKKQ